MHSLLVAPASAGFAAVPPVRPSTSGRHVWMVRSPSSFRPRRQIRLLDAGRAGVEHRSCAKVCRVV
ncbi:MAG TPA: hypothetical protein VK478_14650, partial [Gemmatimonadaceae bacterium]|nr:hypothetical protein [Gemmatimonadaceae bacterium]